MRLICYLLATCLLFHSVTCNPQVILFSEREYRGNSFELTRLNAIGDCQEFWNPSGGVVAEMQRFNGKARSMKLSSGVCVRLYEHDCASMAKGKVLDTFPDSPWLSSFDRIGFSGLVSAVERIECHQRSTSLVTLYAGTNYKGEQLELFALQRVGDCVELYNSVGFNVQISEDLRRFNDKPNSIKLAPGVCVRASEHQCLKPGKFIDIRPNSQLSRNFPKYDFGNMLSSVTVIDCPPPSGVTIFSSSDSINLSGLQEVGDCVELWNPMGKPGVITQDLRKFNDKARSILVAPGHCVRVYEDECGGNGRTLDNIRFGSSFAIDLSRKEFENRVSAVELTCKN